MYVWFHTVLHCCYSAHYTFIYLFIYFFILIYSMLFSIRFEIYYLLTQTKSENSLSQYNKSDKWKIDVVPLPISLIDFIWMVFASFFFFAIFENITTQCGWVGEVWVCCIVITIDGVPFLLWAGSVIRIHSVDRESGKGKREWGGGGRHRQTLVNIPTVCHFPDIPSAWAGNNARQHNALTGDTRWIAVCTLLPLHHTTLDLIQMRSDVPFKHNVIDTRTWTNNYAIISDNW